MIRTSGELRSRTSCSGRSRTRSSSSRGAAGLDFGLDDLRVAVEEDFRAAAAVRPAMTALVSRILVAAALLPVVLLLIWAGAAGWSAWPRSQR